MHRWFGIASLMAVAACAGTACLQVSGDLAPDGAGADTGTEAPDAQRPGVDAGAARTCIACYWPGGLDHLEIACDGEAVRTCVRIALTMPGEPRRYPGVAVGDGWGISSLDLSPQECGGTATGVLGVQAIEASGSFDVNAFPPTRVSFDILAKFPADGGAGVQHVVARELPVTQGCR